MPLCRLPWLFLNRFRLFLTFVLLAIVLLYSGLPKLSLFFSVQELPSVEELRIESNPLRWKPCGEAFRNVMYREGNESHRESHREKLLSVTANDADVDDVLKVLHGLQVTCQSRPHVETEELGKTFAKFLIALKNYTVFRSLERKKLSAKRLLWVCDRGCGGIADRIRGIAYALMLAMFSRRVLHLDWSPQQGLSELAFLEPNAIDWHLKQEEREKAYLQDNHHFYIKTQMVSTKSGVDETPNNLRKLLEATKKESLRWVAVNTNIQPSTLANDTQTVAHQWIKNGMASLSLNKCSVHDLDINLVGLAFRYLFKFSSYLLQEVRAARRVLGLEHMGYVGLHVRTGFEGSEQHEKYHPKLYTKPWQWNESISCAYRYAAQHFANEAPIFLATDSKQVRGMVGSEYRGRIRCLDSPALHVGKLNKLHNKTKAQVKESFFSVWVELILLAESHSLVRGDSGYAFIAQSLCFMPKERTVCALTCTPL